jgi:hypothetical protein
MGAMRTTVVQIAAGYSRSIRRLAWTVLILAATVAVSAGIVFPLWYFSTHDGTAYTIVTLCLFAAALLFLVFRKTQAFWELSTRERARRLRRTFGKLLLVIAYILGLYVTLGFYFVGSLAVAIPLTLVYLLALGYTLYVRKARNSA